MSPKIINNSVLYFMFLSKVNVHVCTARVFQEFVCQTEKLRTDAQMLTVVSPLPKYFIFFGEGTLFEAGHTF